MNKRKVNKSIAKSPIEKIEKPGFFKRFAMLFESIIIIALTGTLIYYSRFWHLPDFVSPNSTQQQFESLNEILTISAISLFGLILLLVRYSFYLRKKIKTQIASEEEITKLAFYDRLTQLPNQSLCHDRLEHALARAATNKTSIAILYISIDDFKDVNTKQGHEAGDILLKEIAKRLSRQLRPSDTLARVTGVEFIIILESLSATDNINAIANKILKNLVKCYRIAMQEVYITGNIGIAMYPHDGDHSKELIKNADSAMCFAKEEGINKLAFFSNELQERIKNKKKIVEQLRGALDRNEFVLHYQPIVEANNYKIIGVEALLRWNNKQLGDVGPDVFIPIAEEIGIITKIGDWVLTQACQQNKVWHQQGHLNLIMSINLSAIQLALNSYATTVGASLAASELEPQYLELEFTENILTKDVKQSMIQLKKLSELGVSIALDDFGTGYSSMQYLPKFPINRLKIDGKFIKNLPDNIVDATIIKGITGLAKEFNLQITAEGVETDQQCQFVKACRVDAIQGYHFSRPLTAEAMSALLPSPPWCEKVVPSI